MPSYSYPYSYPSNVTQVNYALAATTASAATSAAISASVATFAAITVNTPPSGIPGTSQNPAECGTAPSGSKGVKGPNGTITGTNLTECPVGTKECVGLTPPAGYSKVCIQIPEFCDTVDVECPPTLDGYAPTSTTSTTSTTAGPTPVCGDPCVDDSDCTGAVQQEGWGTCSTCIFVNPNYYCGGQQA